MDTRMWNGLVGVAKKRYTASLGEGVVPRPLMMPLVVVLAWETHDVATACELPVVGPAPCLNMVLATRDGHVLHQFPSSEQLLSRSSEGWASVAPDWRPAPAPQPGGELVPPIQAAVNFSFTPIELDHPDPFGVTVVLMEEDGYRISLTEAFAR
ncbi:hypothetical protein K5X85_35765 (plasmid) [Streptomyces sp. A144]|nr:MULTISPECIES: hypothetical protein [Streptomyces]MCC8452827.1 hypothetical protein [Streptomyces rochei]